MKCISPITKKINGKPAKLIEKKNRKGETRHEWTRVTETKNVSFPCGRCAACIKRDYNDLIVRGAFEYSNNRHISHFITFTYSNEFLPKEYDKTHLQNFYKRLRINYLRDTGKQLHIKYLNVTEHGKLRGRIHHHAIIFGLPFHVIVNKKSITIWRYLYTIWGMGWLDCQLSRGFESYIYILKYILKSKLDRLTDKNTKYYNVRLISKNFGAPNQNQKRVLHRKYSNILNHFLTNDTLITDVTQFTLQVQNRSYAIPRYLKNKAYSQLTRDNLSYILQHTIELQDDNKVNADYRVLLKQMKIKANEIK